MSSGKDILYLFGTASDSIVDGPGLRFCVFVQGCPHACVGCHNPESQAFEGGTPTSVAQLIADIRANGLIHDVTLSGGEPFAQAEACAVLAARLKQLGYGVWTYSGYTYEHLVKRSEDDAAVQALLNSTDVLVDGPFIEAQKSLGLLYRGSSNQRLIDIPATRRAGQVVLWSNEEWDFAPPPAW